MGEIKDLKEICPICGGKCVAWQPGPEPRFKVVCENCSFEMGGTFSSPESAEEAFASYCIMAERNRAAANEALKEPDSIRRRILAEAERCVCRDRDKQYGPPEDSFAMIAALWSDLLGKQLTKDILGWQVAAMMAELKLARIMENPGKDDSWIDLAGYAACGGEMANTKKEKTH